MNRLDDLCSFFSVVFDAGAGTGPDQSQDATGDATLRTNFDSRRLVSFLRSAAQVHRKASLAALNSSILIRAPALLKRYQSPLFVLSAAKLWKYL